MNKIVGILFFISFLIVCQQMIGQEKEFERALEPPTRSYQFGNDFLKPTPVALSAIKMEDGLFTRFNQDFYQSNLVYDPVRDPKRLLYNTGVFIGGAVVTFGVLWVLPESFTNWDKDQMREDGIFSRWKENVSAGPIWDSDDFFFNWIAHPWAGAVYYMAARGSGFNPWESFAYSTIMSTFLWEYGVEAFAEVPSWQDILITPTVGSVFGEVFYHWKGKIVRNDRRVLNSKFLGGACLIVMDPFNEFLDAVGVETKHKVQTFSAIMPIQYDFVDKKQVWGLSAVINF
ncbi:DUF3943 domain-containing protein [Namhaeicola litoreus]|uniref:DUF3943 domain-containing protein n=1 Tax=Namhaeicola litoreus TaxID=1052145 RepID=A0ABW3Y4T1_9FLAO